MLDQDVENNSVWSFRYFIQMRALDQKKRLNGVDTFTPEFVEAECKYVLEHRLSMSYHNEAAWAYLRGLLATSKQEA